MSHGLYIPADRGTMDSLIPVEFTPHSVHTKYGLWDEDAGLLHSSVVLGDVNIEAGEVKLNDSYMALGSVPTGTALYMIEVIVYNKDKTRHRNIQVELTSWGNITSLKPSFPLASTIAATRLYDASLNAAYPVRMRLTGQVILEMRDNVETIGITTRDVTIQFI